MAGSAAAGEPDINGLWSGSLYGSDVQAQVEQDKRDVRVVAVVHDLAGGTNVYHFFGVIDHGHMGGRSTLTAGVPVSLATGAVSALGAGAAADAASQPAQPLRGAHWMKEPNFSSSSTRQLHTSLPL